ncbi:MAG: uroporphyrinogen decarboxylase family protein [Kiritimatiellia bacterium]|nr:hypothetical protein [Lentisphaerota bacterium]
MSTKPLPKSSCPDTLGASARLAWATIMGEPSDGIPSGPLVHVMEHRMIDRLAGVPPQAYAANPDQVYMEMERRIGVCMIDQYLALNPLTMGASGYGDDKPRGATTGLERIEADGMLIDSPEAVVAHLEHIVLPALQTRLRDIESDPETYICHRVRELAGKERARQDEFGPDILKVPFACAKFPTLKYGRYGYENYFMAYALYPEVMEKEFSLEGDLAVWNNRAVVRACAEHNLPPLIRLDHDMADSRGTLVDIKSLDKLWFPNFTRAIAPLVDSPVKLIWHCDGNLMQMVPRLLEAGLDGFQGFQYEDGMDYERICKMQTRDGRSLLIQAGVSVTRTLPLGTPDDVRKELRWLVENGPETGLFLGASSSIAPGVPWENLQAFVEGLQYYRQHGR